MKNRVLASFIVDNAPAADPQAAVTYANREPSMNPPGNSPATDQGPDLVLLVHGTNSYSKYDQWPIPGATIATSEDLAKLQSAISPEERWWHIAGAFAARINQLFTDDSGRHLADCDAEELQQQMPWSQPSLFHRKFSRRRTFVWSGLNQERDRRQAGRRLFNGMLELEKLLEGSDRGYHLVGHSHGGTVIWYALQEAVSRNRPLRQLRSWTTVATPFPTFLPVPGRVKQLLTLLVLIIACFIWAGRSVGPLTIQRGFVREWEWLSTSPTRAGKWFSALFTFSPLRHDPLAPEGALSLATRGLLLLLILLTAWLLIESLVGLFRVWQLRRRRRNAIAAWKLYGRQWLGLTSELDEALAGTACTVGFYLPKMFYLLPLSEWLVSAILRPKIQSSDRGMLLAYISNEPVFHQNARGFLPSNLDQRVQQFAESELSRGYRTSLSRFVSDARSPSATKAILREYYEKFGIGQELIHNAYFAVPEIQAAIAAHILYWRTPKTQSQEVARLLDNPTLEWLGTLPGNAEGQFPPTRIADGPRVPLVPDSALGSDILGRSFRASLKPLDGTPDLSRFGVNALVVLFAWFVFNSIGSDLRVILPNRAVIQLEKRFHVPVLASRDGWIVDLSRSSLTEETLVPLLPYMQDLGEIDTLDFSGSEQITELTNLSQVREIWGLRGLTRLNLSHCPNLQRVDVGFDHIQEVDLSACPQLTSVIFRSWYLKKVDLLESTQVTELMLESTSLTDLRPFENLQKLKQLSLIKTPVKDLGPLANLMNVQELRVEDTGITDLGPMSGWQQLQSLSIANTPIDFRVLLEDERKSRTTRKPIGILDLAPLSHMTRLSSLSLSNVAVRDFSPLARIESLKGLDIIDVDVSDLSEVGKVRGLQSLALMGLPIKDLTPLADLTELKTLILFKCPDANDVGPLANLTNLETLDLNLSGVKDVQALADLKKLRFLNLTFSGVQIKDVPESIRKYAGRAD